MKCLKIDLITIVVAQDSESSIGSKFRGWLPTFPFVLWIMVSASYLIKRKPQFQIGSGLTSLCPWNVPLLLRSSGEYWKKNRLRYYPIYLRLMEFYFPCFLSVLIPLFKIWDISSVVKHRCSVRLFCVPKVIWPCGKQVAQKRRIREHHCLFVQISFTL